MENDEILELNDEIQNLQKKIYDLENGIDYFQKEKVSIYFIIKSNESSLFIKNKIKYYINYTNTNYYIAKLESDYENIIKFMNLIKKIDVEIISESEFNLIQKKN
jgi:hypothetical protein